MAGNTCSMIADSCATTSVISVSRPVAKMSTMKNERGITVSVSTMSRTLLNAVAKSSWRAYDSDKSSETSTLPLSIASSTSPDAGVELMAMKNLGEPLRTISNSPPAKKGAKKECKCSKIRGRLATGLAERTRTPQRMSRPADEAEGTSTHRR